MNWWIVIGGWLTASAGIGIGWWYGYRLGFIAGRTFERERLIYRRPEES